MPREESSQELAKGPHKKVFNARVLPDYQELPPLIDQDKGSLPLDTALFIASMPNTNSRILQIKEATVQPLLSWETTKARMEEKVRLWNLKMCPKGGLWKPTSANDNAKKRPAEDPLNDEQNAQKIPQKPGPRFSISSQPQCGLEKLALHLVKE